MADNFTFKDSTGATQTCRSTDNSGIHTTHTIIAKTNGTGINVGQTTMVESFPVVLASNQTVIPVSDNSGSLTIDGAVSVTGSAAVTIIDGGDVTLGAKADSAASSDTGTFSLMSLVKRLLSITIGSITETAPATDTASSGVNGRLQRIAQNITSFIGSLTETAPATDTASSAVNGRLQRIAQRITTSIGYLTSIDTYTQSSNNLLSTIDSDTGLILVDTNNMESHTSNTSNVLGTTADAVTTTDTTGTIKSAMRGLIKWAYERMPVALGQGTMAQSLRVVLPSDQSSLSIYGNTVAFHIDGATLGASPITSFVTGDCIGTLCTLTSVAVLKSTTLMSIAMQANAVATGTWDMTLMFFSENPTASTFTDDAAVVINSADFDKLDAYHTIVEADWKTIATRKYYNIGNLNKVVASSGSVWMAIVANNTCEIPANGLEITCGFNLG